MTASTDIVATESQHRLSPFLIFLLGMVLGGLISGIIVANSMAVRKADPTDHGQGLYIVRLDRDLSSTIVGFEKSHRSLQILGTIVRSDHDDDEAVIVTTKH